jgi:hypothetical protein
MEEEIINCPSSGLKTPERLLSFVCPKSWSRLDETVDEDIRFCNVCSKNVYRCRTDEDLKRNGHLRHCIALKSNERELMGMSLPLPDRELDDDYDDYDDCPF